MRRHAPSSPAFLRAPARRSLLVLVAIVVASGTIGLVADRGRRASGTAFVWTLDTVATVGSIPAPETVGGQIVKVAADRARRRYALLRPGDGDGVLRLRAISPTCSHERRTQKLIDATSDHYIICGFGRVGRQVARDLRAAGARYVVIDAQPGEPRARRGRRRALHRGRAVRRRGPARRGDRCAPAAVIACVDSDADNIFITLTARELRPDIAIVARASDEDSETKLLRAGATRVISPYKTSGAEMARLALHPQVSRRGRGRAGVPDGGDRGRAGLRGRGPADRRRPRRCDHRRRARRATDSSSPSRRPRPCCTPATS